MQLSKIFQKNVEIWSRTCPKEAVLLPYISTDSLLDWETKLKEPNFKKKEEGKSFFLHSNSGAPQEAQQWFQNLPLQNVQLVCVYGVGLGYYYDAILPWLKKNRKRRVVFLEDDLAIIHKFLETERGAKMLQDSQVQLLYFKDLKDSQVFGVLYWNFAMMPLIVTGLQSYAKHKSEIFEELKHKIAYDAAKNNALVDEYLKFGVNFYFNFYQNLLLLENSYFGNALFGKFNKVPAIICGAGPSLAKQLPLLHEMHGKALIFAGGSALNALNAAGIQPNFGAGIDPNPAQFERLSTNQAYEVPFFYRNRMFHNAFKLIHGPRLYIAGSGGYDTSEFFEKKFGIEAENIDEGHNVVNFCLQLANGMGCDPIIFVGMDLAYTGMQAYSPGVVTENTVVLDAQKEDETPFLKPDIFGRPTYTLWKWVSESDWIGDFAKEHPNLNLFNCTEGGLGFPGVSNVPFGELCKEKLTRNHELAGRIHGEIQTSKITQVTHRKIVRAMHELSKSLKRTMEFLKMLIEESHEMLNKLKSGQKEVQQSGRSVLAETELAEEDGYKHVVDIFNEAYSHMLSGDVHSIYLRHRSERTRLLKKLPLSIKKYQFLHKVALVNDELIGYALKEEKKHKAGKKEIVNIPAVNTGEYSFEKNYLKIQDPETGLNIKLPFEPLRVPKERKDGQEVAPGYILKAIFDQAGKLYECFIEKDGKPDGQCLLFYPDGNVKEETFYLAGKLHGSATFFSENGKVLAKAWFLHGRQEGKGWWYYLSGALYSLQRFKQGVWHGQQEYYYEDGSLKTLLNYEHGKLVGEPLLTKSKAEATRLAKIAKEQDFQGSYRTGFPR